MTEQYQPSGREVLGEITDGITNGVKKVVNMNTLKSMGKAAAIIVGVPLVVNSLPYWIPTLIRLNKGLSSPAAGRNAENNNRNNNEPDGQNTNEPSFLEKTAWAVCVVGVPVSIIGQIYAYSYAIEQGYGKALLIPVATNIASGLYEIGRKVYKSAEKRLIEKRLHQNNNDLVSKLEVRK
ncbi:MAG: hypothetical protein WCK90_03575 [archaeon]